MTDSKNRRARDRTLNTECKLQSALILMSSKEKCTKWFTIEGHLKILEIVSELYALQQVYSLSVLLRLRARLAENNRILRKELSAYIITTTVLYHLCRKRKK